MISGKLLFVLNYSILWHLGHSNVATVTFLVKCLIYRFTGYRGDPPVTEIFETITMVSQAKILVLATDSRYNTFDWYSQICKTIHNKQGIFGINFVVWACARDTTQLGPIYFRQRGPKSIHPGRHVINYYNIYCKYFM